MYESLVTGVPDFSMMRISATCPINERSSFRREIADRDSVEQDLYAFENSDSLISDSAESPDTCPPWNSTAKIYPRDFENHRVSILLSSNLPTLLWDFSSTHEDLSPAQLSSTRKVGG